MSIIQRIVFMGSPEFGCPTLNHLLTRSDTKLVGIITQPDKKKGRGKIFSPTPIKQWAECHHVPVYCPRSKSDIIPQLMQWQPTLVIVIAYGMILPNDVVTTYTCINGHASLLPAYRGASPIQRALLNQDTETGITLIHMNDKMDEGDILLSQSIPIEPSDNFQTLHNRLATLCADTIQNYLNNPQPGTPQDHTVATYCQKLSTQDRQLNHSESVTEKYAKIRAFSPNPGAFIIQNDIPIKIIDAKHDNQGLTPLRVQPPGKRVMTYEDYLRGGYPKLCLQNE